MVNRQKPGKFYAILAGLWLLTLFLEANGKDAARVGGAYRYLHLPLGDSLMSLLVLARQIDWSYVGLMVICLGGSFWVYRRIKTAGDQEDSYKPLMLGAASCLGLMFIFLILLCAKVTPSYASRPDVSFGLYFYGLLLIFNGGSYLLQKAALANKLLLVVLWIFLVIGTNPSSLFRESNHIGQPPYECMAVSRNILAQAQAADLSGQHDFVLKVPKGAPGSNWPHPPAFLGDVLSRTLSAHGLVSHRLKIKVQVEPKMNKEFYK